MDGGTLTFGDRLRAEREKRAIGLSEIAESTKIRKSYLEALERNAFGELPGMVFNKGFVRAYAEFLGADPEPLLKAYARELRVRGTAEPAAAGDPLEELRKAIDKSCASRPSATPVWLLTALLLLGAIAAAGFGVAWLLARSKDAPPIEAPPVASLALPAPPIPTATPLPALPERLELPPSEEPEVRIATEPTPPVATRLTVDDFGVGTSVVKRALVAKSDRLRAGTDAWFWTLVLGGRPGDRVHHVWLHEGQVVRILELPVDGARWRTYSRQALPSDAVGPWAVEARDLSGAVLARTEFDCYGP